MALMKRKNNFEEDEVYINEEVKIIQEEEANGNEHLTPL
jgi:hypothetical protein